MTGREGNNMARRVLGYWDCPVCGSKEIAGDVMNCPACGRARGDVKFYLKNNAEQGAREADEREDIEYLTKEQEQEIGKNPDWYCSFCNSLNRDNAKFCGNCGATRADSDSNYFDQLKKREEAERAEREAQERNRPQTKPKSHLPLLLAIAVVLVLLITYMSGRDTKGDLQVTDIAWTRSVPVEQHQQLTETGWTLPAGAEEISRTRAIHHYEDVYDHDETREVQRSRQVVDHYETYYTYTDNGNGSFDEVEHERPVYKTEYYTETVKQPVYRREPRYQTQYTYKIWKWIPVREVKASGTDHDARWPEPTLAEDERAGDARTEEYTFTEVDGKGVSTTWTVDEAAWKDINVGDRISIASARSGGQSWIVDDKGNEIARVRKK